MRKRGNVTDMPAPGKTTNDSHSNSTTPRRPAADPSVAVIGCGYWGRNLVRNFHDFGALAAIFDSDETTAAALHEQYGAENRAFIDILGDPDIHGVAIAAPAEQHFAVAREALLAGKHVFVEKPLALEVAQAESLCALAESADRTLMVGHLLQYHTAFLKLRELVGEGALGRLQYLYSNRLNLGKIRREENILWSFAPHDISMILSLIGEEPDQVTATGASYLHKAIADVTTTQLRFPGGERAHVFVSWLHPFKEQKLVVVGDAAMAVFDDSLAWPEKLVLYKHRISWRDGMPLPEKAEGKPVPLTESEPLRAECRHFLDCIVSGDRPRTDGREGVRVLRVLAAAEQAMRAGDAVAPAAPASRPRVTIHESAYIDDGVEIGEGTKIWHFSHVLGGCRIGRDCVLGQNVMVGPDVTMGDKCKIQNNVSLYRGVMLEDGVFCGPSCVFTNVNNPRAEIERKEEFRPTPVRRGASIGANATIVCGHEIGAYSFIAAGAVVTSDVPAFALMAGVPARRMGWISRAGERLGEDLVCPASGQIYRETGPDRLEEIT